MRIYGPQIFYTSKPALQRALAEKPTFVKHNKLFQLKF